MPIPNPTRSDFGTKTTTHRDKACGLLYAYVLFWYNEVKDQPDICSTSFHWMDTSILHLLYGKSIIK